MSKRVIERNMFFGAKKNIFKKAYDLRNNMIEAEELLWEELRNRNLFKERFKKQHPVDIFILDFYCHKYKLAIEIDGDIHLEKDIQEYDDGRTHDLEKLGIKVLRFTNKEVKEQRDKVIFKILEEIRILSPL
jgi:very-short-patch-repair endonuclease